MTGIASSILNTMPFILTCATKAHFSISDHSPWKANPTSLSSCTNFFCYHHHVAHTHMLTTMVDSCQEGTALTHSSCSPELHWPVQAIKTLPLAPAVGSSTQLERIVPQERALIFGSSKHTTSTLQQLITLTSSRIQSLYIPT